MRFYNLNPQITHMLYLYIVRVSVYSWGAFAVSDFSPDPL